MLRVPPINTPENHCPEFSSPNPPTPKEHTPSKVPSSLLSYSSLESSNLLSFPHNSLSSEIESWNPNPDTSSSSSIVTAAKSSLAPPTASSVTSAATPEYSPSIVLLPFQVRSFAITFALGFLSSFNSFSIFTDSLWCLFCRIDGEARRVVWFVCDFKVSIAKRRLRDLDLGHRRRRFGKHNRGIRPCLVEIDSSVEDQSHSLSTEVAQEGFSCSVVVFVQCQSLSAEIVPHLRRIAAVRGGATHRPPLSVPAGAG